MPFDNSSLLPTTQIYDPSEIQEMDVNSEEFKEFIVQLSLTQLDLLTNLNLKGGGGYTQMQYVTGNKWFPNPTKTNAPTRDSIRVALPFTQTIAGVTTYVTLPNNGSIFMDHNINVTADTIWVIQGGAATNTAGLTGIPIPYINPINGNAVSIQTNNTQIEIRTNADFTALNVVNVYLEYILG